MLDLAFFPHSPFPVSSPLFFVPKKGGGELRTCIDYRTLNKATIKNRYPLPLIPVLLDQVKGSTIYTKLDLRGAYHLIRVHEGDEWKTAFWTKFGLYEYTVMPFGLCNTPAAFQYFINEVLSDFLDVCVVVYIDDILIFSQTEFDHVQHVKAVLQRLRENSLYVKLDKCFFHTSSVEFLGYILSSEGITMDTRKVDAVMKWPVPTSVKEVQSFLGFANFYRRFISHFSEVVAPITSLLKKNKPFQWSLEAGKAFILLKERFTSAPILSHPDPDQPFFVEADASQIAVGGILSQRDPATGHLHPVAYFSKKLLPAEQNYTITERELLAIKLTFQEWRHYLLGAKHMITIYTDHKNLQFFRSIKALTPRQMRWLLFFSEYEFLITYRPASQQTKSDVLSHFGYAMTDEIRSLPPNIISTDKIIATCSQKDFLSLIQTALLLENSEEWLGKGGQTILNGLFYYYDRLFIPTPELRRKAILWCHDSALTGHLGVKKTIDLCKRYFWWATLSTDVREHVQSCITCIQNKPTHSIPVGLLQPLEVPPYPWHSISMDFVTDLPNSNGFTTILVILDLFSKMADLFPLKKMPTATLLAEFFLSNFVKLHGLPSVIISDRGPQFISKFWRGYVPSWV